MFSFSGCESHLLQLFFYSLVTATLTPASANLFLISCVVCSIFSHVALSYPSHLVPVCLPFTTSQFCLCLLHSLDTADWAQPASFATLLIKLNHLLKGVHSASTGSSLFPVFQPGISSENHKE